MTHDHNQCARRLTAIQDALIRLGQPSKTRPRKIYNAAQDIEGIVQAIMRDALTADPELARLESMRP